ncbi:ABC transporter permease subunit [Streptomyces sp. NPDC047453]|uniref:ABC transporter permease n=1 Tax=Streptomyces sp. NPDC047453 TaxID=3154812 RepID=UPI0033CD6E4B
MSAIHTAAGGDSRTRSAGRSPGLGAARRRRLPRLAGWLGVVPLLVFAVVVFGLAFATMVFGAFTTPETAPGGAHLTGANMSASLHGAYLTALLGSVKLSAVSALIATVVGLPIAHVIVTSRFHSLRKAVLAASGVLANFGGVPLAFAFVATLGNAGVLTSRFHLRSHGWNLYGFWGLTLVYLYFLIPLMVLTLTPALEGLRRQWGEAARNNGANAFQYWTHVALPILTPSLLGGYVLLFGSAFSAYATAAAMVGSSVPLVTMQIADALSGNVLVGQGNVALALGVDMVLVAGLVMAVQLPLQRRSARWLA